MLILTIILIRKWKASPVRVSPSTAQEKVYWPCQFGFVHLAVGGRHWNVDWRMRELKGTPGFQEDAVAKSLAISISSSTDYADTIIFENSR